MSWDSSIPSPLDWRTLEDSGHREGERSNSSHYGSANNQMSEVLLVQAVRVLVDERFQVEEAECEFCKPSKQLVADLVEEEVVHRFWEGRWYTCSVLPKS